MTDCKKITGCFLLSIIAAPFLFAVYFVTKQQCIHFDMDMHFTGAGLTTIRIKVDEIHWLRYGKELMADNKLIDVKSIEMDNDTAVITGYVDEKEEQLLSQLNDIHKEKNNLSSDFNAAKFIFLPFFAQQHTTIDVGLIALVPMSYHCAHKLCYISINPAVTSPPPKYFS